MSGLMEKKSSIVWKAGDTAICKHCGREIVHDNAEDGMPWAVGNWGYYCQNGDGSHLPEDKAKSVLKLLSEL